MSTLITNDVKYKLNRLGALQGVPNFGTLLQDWSDKAKEYAEFDYFYDDFSGVNIFQAQNGGAADGTTGATNNMITKRGNVFEYFILGAGQTITTFPRTDEGIDVTMDATDDEGVEIWESNNAYADSTYVIGTSDPFYLEAKIRISEVGKFDECMFGFRKVEAGNAAIGSYTDYVAVNVDNGTVKILDGVGGTDSSHTCTDAITDGQYIIVRMEYDEEAGLTRMINLANEMKAVYTAHIADTDMHTTAADTVNVITADNAYDLASLKTLIGDMLTQYDAHEGDSELGAAWLYHAAQETGDVSLASAVAPTTLAECSIRLNDLREKFIDHEADATSHAVQTQHTPSLQNAGCMMLKVGANTTTLTQVSNDAGYTFTDALSVMPFFRQLHDASAASVIELIEWKRGPLT